MLSELTSGLQLRKTELWLKTDIKTNFSIKLIVVNNPISIACVVIFKLWLGFL